MSTNSVPDTAVPTNAAKPTPKAPAAPAVKATAKPRAKSAPPPSPTAVPRAAAKAAAVATAKTKAKRAAKTDKTAKPKKAKLVRDSFTMPQSEYDLIAAVKERCVAKGLAVKKSEVLRAAVVGFGAQSDDFIMAAVQALEVIKTGRPPKGQK